MRKNIKGTVTRAKGIGELSPEIARESMFTPEFQRLEVLEPDDISADLLYSLMGENIQPRKEFVFNNIDFREIKE